MATSLYSVRTSASSSIFHSFTKQFNLISKNYKKTCNKVYEISKKHFCLLKKANAMKNIHISVDTYNWKFSCMSVVSCVSYTIELTYILIFTVWNSNSKVTYCFCELFQSMAYFRNFTSDRSIPLMSCTDHQTKSCMSKSCMSVVPSHGQ